MFAKAADSTAAASSRHVRIGPTLDQDIEIPAEGRDRKIDSLAAFLRTVMPGKALCVKVTLKKRQRSDAQNNALFGVAYPPLMEFMGLRGEQEKEELHETLCGLFFGWHHYELLGEARKKPKRTTTRNEQGKRDVIPVTEFMAFYAFVQQRGAEIGCYIPDPDPNWFATHDRKAA